MIKLNGDAKINANDMVWPKIRFMLKQLKEKTDKLEVSALYGGTSLPPFILDKYKKWRNYNSEQNSEQGRSKDFIATDETQKENGKDKRWSVWERDKPPRCSRQLPTGARK